MELGKLNKAIYVVWIFLILTIVDHFIDYFFGRYNIINIITNCVSVFFALLYWAHLYTIFKNSLSINNIRKQVLYIIFSDIILFALLIFVTIAKANENNTLNGNETVLGILGIFVFVTVIIRFICNLQLGFKFYNKEQETELRNFGLSFHLRNIALIGTVVIYRNIELRGLYHILIIFDLLPLWFTYKIYKKILLTEK